MLIENLVISEFKINDTCPFCMKSLSWKLSGRGKHYGGYCLTHGFVKIIRSPLFAEEPVKQKGIFEKIWIYFFGE